MKPIERFLRETDRVPLMPMPTPLHPMHYQPSGKDVSLLIKRDDMTGVGPGGRSAALSSSWGKPDPGGHPKSWRRGRSNQIYAL